MEIQESLGLAAMRDEIEFPHRQLVRELTRQTELLRKAQHVAHVGHWIWHVQTNRLEWSEEMFRIFGLDRDTFTGDLNEILRTSIHPEDRDAVERSNRSVLEHGKPVPLEYRVILPDGTVRVVWGEAYELLVNGAGQPEILAGVVQDITERKRVELALQENHRFLRLVLSHAPLILSAVDVDGRFIISEGRGLLDIGRRPGELPNATVWDLYRNRPEILERIRLAMSGQSIHALVKLNGRDLDSYYEPIQDDAGRILGVVVLAHDLTQQMTTEIELRDAKARLRTILDTVGDPIFVKDDQHRMVLANRAFDKIFGLEEGFAIGKTLAEHVPPEEREHFLAVDRHVLDTGIMDEREESLSIRGGQPRTIFTRKTRFVEASGERFLVGSIHDVTERKRSEEERRVLQQQLFQAQKLEAMGQLAGGVAHDFNNILGAMIMQLNLLEMMPEPSREDLLETVADLLECANRAAALTRQLLIFSRRQPMTISRYDLNALLRDVTRMLRRIIGESVLFSVDLSHDPLWIACDSGMIEQVVTNLCVNARDAMPKGGSLVITTREVVLDDAAAKRRTGVRPGNFACIEVVDTGTGIAPDVLDHIFEPFFTTKPQGQGTGLGLATIHGIVLKHGGFVEVDSVVGRGSTFRVYLPSVDVVGADEKRTEERPIRGGTESILVVEDEVPVRRIAVRFLRNLGYRVSEADNGIAALEVWKREGGQFDLVFTDMVMPEGLSGLDLISRLRHTTPDLRAIIATGYSAEIFEGKLPLRDHVRYLQKPFDLGTLAGVVREILDATT